MKVPELGKVFLYQNKSEKVKEYPVENRKLLLKKDPPICSQGSSKIRALGSSLGRDGVINKNLVKFQKMSLREENI